MGCESVAFWIVFIIIFLALFILACIMADSTAPEGQSFKEIGERLKKEEEEKNGKKINNN